MPLSVSAIEVSTHSRPKAAVHVCGGDVCQVDVSTHSRPKAAVFGAAVFLVSVVFQHTAARRRLTRHPCAANCLKVSTHSRPKAAA